jgi:hypothetical protein
MVTLVAARAKHEGAFAYLVGDSVALNAEILALKRSGVETGTCDARAIDVDGTENLPVVGRVDIALDWEGRLAFQRVHWQLSGSLLIRWMRCVLPNKASFVIWPIGVWAMKRI